METQLILELIGYTASLLIAISLMMKSLIRLRILNGIGALVFVIYGILIKAYPVAVLNGLIVVIDVYYLSQMLRRRDYFTLMEVKPDSTYLRFFINFHLDDIHKFIPSFSPNIQDGDFSFFILRNTIPAGLIILRQREEKGQILLDYALENFRDFKIGSFIFEDNAGLLINRGINNLEAHGKTKPHIQYLRQMGFREIKDGKFRKELLPHIIRDKNI